MVLRRTFYSTCFLLFFACFYLAAREQILLDPLASLEDDRKGIEDPGLEKSFLKTDSLSELDDLIDSIDNTVLQTRAAATCCSQDSRIVISLKLIRENLCGIEETLCSCCEFQSSRLDLILSILENLNFSDLTSILDVATSLSSELVTNVSIANELALSVQETLSNLEDIIASCCESTGSAIEACCSTLSEQGFSCCEALSDDIASCCLTLSEQGFSCCEALADLIVSTADSGASCCELLTSNLDAALGSLSAQIDSCCENLTSAIAEGAQVVLDEIGSCCAAIDAAIASSTEVLETLISTNDEILNSNLMIISDQIESCCEAQASTFDDCCSVLNSKLDEIICHLDCICIRQSDLGDFLIPGGPVAGGFTRAAYLITSPGVYCVVEDLSNPGLSSPATSTLIYIGSDNATLRLNDHTLNVGGLRGGIVAGMPAGAINQFEVMHGLLTGTPCVNPVLVVGGNNFSLQDLSVEGTSGTGVTIDDNGGTPSTHGILEQIRSCNSSVGNGISIFDSNNIVVHCIVSGNGGMGLHLRDCDQCTIRNLEAFGNGSNGVFLETVSAGNTNHVFENVIASQNASDGFFLSQIVQNCVFKNCIASENGVIGFDLRNTGATPANISTGNFFDCCIAHNNTSHGFQIGDGASPASEEGHNHNIFDSCECTENGGSGFIIASDLTDPSKPIDNIIRRCAATGNTVDGFNNSGAALSGDNVFLANTARNNGGGTNFVNVTNAEVVGGINVHDDVGAWVNIDLDAPASIPLAEQFESCCSTINSKLDELLCQVDCICIHQSDLGDFLIPGGPIVGGTTRAAYIIDSPGVYCVVEDLDDSTLVTSPATSTIIYIGSDNVVLDMHNHTLGASTSQGIIAATKLVGGGQIEQLQIINGQLSGPPLAPGAFSLLVAGANNFVIHDITCDGGGIRIDQNGDGVPSEQGVFYNIQCCNGGGMSIILSKNIEVRESLFSGNIGTGIGLSGSASCILYRIDVFENGSTGIVVGTSSACTLKECVSNRNTGNGFLVQAPLAVIPMAPSTASINNLFYQCTASQNGIAGFSLGEVGDFFPKNNNIISECSFSNNASHGFTIVASSTRIQNVIEYCNSIRNAGIGFNNTGSAAAADNMYIANVARGNVGGDYVALFDTVSTPAAGGAWHNISRP